MIWGFLIALSAISLVWIGLSLFGVFPFFTIGIMGLVVIWAGGIVLLKICLFAKVLFDRLDSKEDDYYSKNVDK